MLTMEEERSPNMDNYITFAQLADALRRCGSTPTLDTCKGCAYYRGPDPALCIPYMMERAAAIIDMLATDPPAVPRDQWADLAELE